MNNFPKMLRCSFMCPFTARRLMSNGKFSPYFRDCSIEKPCPFSSFSNEFRANLPKDKILTINVACTVKIKPLDVQSQLDDCVIARAYGPQRNEISMKLMERESSLLFFADHSTQLQDVKKNYLEVEIPVRSDLEVISKLGNVSVENFVSDQMSVQAENGDISCRKLNCGKIHLKSFIGDIICGGTLLGSIKLEAEKLGSIKGANFQGNLLEIKTDEGDIVVSSTYSDNSSFTTKKGSVNLKNLHRRSCVAIQKGNLSISGLDGSLDARVQDGNIKVQVTQLNADSYIETRNGNVSLSMAQDNVCHLDLSASDILILEENLSSTGKIENTRYGKIFKSFPRSHSTLATMKVVSENGKVQLKEESWISSLNLGSH